MSHMRSHQEPDDLPGGMFAIVAAMYDKGGDLLVVTMPQSLLDHPRYGEWSWEATFPFDMQITAPDYIRVSAASDDAEAAVRALAELSDTLPVVVDDGWLC